MTILLIFGWMLIGSAFIILGWARPGWRRRYPLSIYNAALMMSLGMDTHAAGWIFTTYGRMEQILRDGASFATDDPLYYAGAALVLIGKSLFVWVAALGEGRTYRRPFWFAYLAVMAGWPLVAGALSA